MTVIKTEKHLIKPKALENANVIIFIVDGKTGITQSDEDVAKILRKQKVPVVLVASKRHSDTVTSCAFHITYNQSLFTK